MNLETLYQPVDDSNLLAKAVMRAGDILGMTQKELAEVLGQSESAMSRLARQTVTIAPDTKDGEIILLFIRMYRSLDALFGGRQMDIRQWFASPNRALSGIPRELIKTLQGMFYVLTYLDAMRGKV